MIDPKSYLADRFAPDLELSIIPSRTEAETVVRLVARGAPQQSASFLRRRQRLRPFGRRRLELPDDRFAVDLRVFGLRNWSHVLNIGVPIALKVADLLHERGLQKPALVVNENLSVKITTFLQRLGFQVVETDEAVVAPFVSYEEKGGGRSGLHRVSHDFLAPHLDWICHDVLEPVQDFGGKIFLNRRETRNITNTEEIAALLEAKGFKTIYAEDWSLDEQIQMILRAREIVAIHGAALAPLLYRRPQEGALRFVELFAPGHVVPFFLHMTYRLPCEYIGVRGALDQSMVPGLYPGGTHKISFTDRHSLRPFHLDPESLELALSPVRIRERFGDATEVWPLRSEQPE